VTNQPAQSINRAQPGQLPGMASESQGLIVISTGFDPADKQRTHPSGRCELSVEAMGLLGHCARLLRPGGLLFVYGLPRELAVWGECLASRRDETRQMVFKYWIAMDLDDARAGACLKPTHLGLLLFVKDRVGKSKQAPLRLNTEAVRLPHAFCAACGKNLKDWGGKKHLMNPRGAAPSDVWRDLPRRLIRDGVIPEDVLGRVLALAGVGEEAALHVVLEGGGVQIEADARSASLTMSTSSSDGEWKEIQQLETDHVHQGDCVSFLRKVKALHPKGVFDLAFADPPYNLEKSYDTYADALAEQHYLEWCNQWLEGMAQTLKPGGSLIVLNLPKWAIHHAAFLNRHLEFRHWIVWDALSDPRGKLMPAHYALLYYTKPGGKPVFNYSPVGARPKEGFVLPPDSPTYCLRAKCIKERKAAGDDAKVELSDIWFDIHRIKHKRDRDAHPCQLPEKLLERIIKLTTRPVDLVFDPFCGAGTTAIAAAKLGRKFVVVDTDPIYVRITREKLAAMKRNASTNGDLAVPRNSVTRPRAASSKRGIELYLQNLARKLGRVPTENEVMADRPEILREIDLTYATRGAAFKRAKVVLSNPA
jgi:site-specific DNA-methyltransferase (adenine-specific)